MLILTWGELIDLIFNGDSRNRYRDERRYADFSMEVSGPEGSFKKTEWRKVLMHLLQMQLFRLSGQVMMNS